MASQNLVHALAAFTDYSPVPLGSAATLLCIFLGATWLHRTLTRGGKNKLDDDDDECKYPPTPPEKHWLFGHVLHLNPENLGVHKQSSHDVLFEAWMPKLNSKVLMFELPVMGRIIVVGDAALAKHVLHSKRKDDSSESLFPKSPTYKTILPLTGRKSIVVTEGKEWQTQRRLYNPGFTPEYLKSVVSIIAQKCDRFLAVCEKEDVDHGVPTDMLMRAVDLTSDVIAQVAFGEDWGNDSAEGSENENKNENETTITNAKTIIQKNGMQTLNKSRELVTIIGQIYREPMQRFLNVFRVYRSWRLASDLNWDMQCLVQRRLDTMRRAEESKHSEDDPQTMPNDILSLALSSTLRESKDSSVSFSSDDMENVISQLKTFYFAGHDTTATNIAWAYWLLAQHPEKMEKARQEVRDHIGEKWAENVVRNGNNLEDGLTYEMLQQCQYLDSVAREALRLYPPAASTRYAPDPAAKFGKYKLGHSVIHINAYAIQRDPELWGDDANDFVPERFLGNDGRKLVTSNMFLPFSKGHRDCIGKYFALLEAKIALAALVTRYDAAAVDAEKEVYTTRLTSIPMNGCKVKLSLRN